MLSAHSCPVGDLGAMDTGGMSVYIRELARELGKQGHSVDIYTRVHDPDDPVVVELGERARLIHLKAGEAEKIHKLAVYAWSRTRHVAFTSTHFYWLRPTVAR